VVQYFLSLHPVVLQMLTDQKTDIKGFADFMQKLSTVKEHVPNLKEKVEYIKNLYEVGVNGFINQFFA